LRFCEIKILAKSTWKLQPVHMPSDLVMTLTFDLLYTLRGRSRRG